MLSCEEPDEEVKIRVAGPKWDGLLIHELGDTHLHERAKRRRRTVQMEEQGAEPVLPLSRQGPTAIELPHTRSNNSNGEGHVAEATVTGGDSTGTRAESPQ